MKHRDQRVFLNAANVGALTALTGEGAIQVPVNSLRVLALAVGGMTALWFTAYGVGLAFGYAAAKGDRPARQQSRATKHLRRTLPIRTPTTEEPSTNVLVADDWASAWWPNPNTTEEPDLYGHPTKELTP